MCRKWLLLLGFVHAAHGVPTRNLQQPAVYEISTRPWLYSLAQSGLKANCGEHGEYVCLKDVPLKEWQAIADDSIDMVWLMGVWGLGKYGLVHDRTAPMLDNFRHDLPDIQPEDVIGSPYAIWNYSVHPDIGTDKDLAAVRKLLHGLGMRLMVDFIPNHESVDSVMKNLHPDIFVQKPEHGDFPAKWWTEQNGLFAFGRGPYDGPWTDTLQVNYWHPKTVQIMTDTLKSIASRADGIRCDMGMLLLNDVIERTWGGVMQAGGFNRPQEEFWKIAIDAVRKEHPDTLFMAEAYDYYITQPPEKAKLQELGFNVVYDKTVLDSLDAGNLDALKAYIGNMWQDYFVGTAHFVENHDERRAAQVLHGGQQAFVGSVLASTIPGLRLFYFGQFQGFKAKLDVQLRRATAEVPDEALHAQYTKLLAILSHEVFHKGTWTFLHVPKEGTGWRLCAWSWRLGGVKRLVVVNFSDATAWQNIVLTDAQGDGGDGITITELLSGEKYQRSAAEMRQTGLGVLVNPWTAQIFQYDGGSSNAVAELLV